MNGMLLTAGTGGDVEPFLPLREPTARLRQ